MHMRRASDSTAPFLQKRNFFKNSDKNPQNGNPSSFDHEDDDDHLDGEENQD